MTTYKEPFGKAWIKILKNDFFPNVLNNAQPIIMNIHVGTGWEWLSPKVPVDGTLIQIEVNEEEISQCNYNDSNFICYVNFGKGYDFLPIPYTSIYSIYIGNHTNSINNPIPTLPYNLDEETILKLTKLKEEQNDTMENTN